MLISSKTIDDVNAVPPLDVVQKFNIEIKKAGANWKAKSPFTEEKTASFVVSPAKNTWKCFSSGHGGGSGVSFAMQYKKIDWIEAIKLVADMFNINVEYDNSPSGRAYQETQKVINSLADINAQAAVYFSENLHLLEDKFVRSTPEMNEKFNIGFAPNEWQGLYKYLGEAGYSDVQMLESGLISEGKSRKYDTFRGRVMFPIYDYSGKIVGFSGRLAVDVENDPPKVLNSRDTEAFSKSKCLLGIYQAKQDIVKQNKCIAVEGNYDLTSLHQYLFLNTVANLGTAFTKDHAKLIGKYTKNLCFFIDADKAGFKSIEPHVKTALENGFNVSLMIPDVEGTDPDDWCKQFKKKRSKKGEIDIDAAHDEFESKEQDAVDYMAAQYFAKVVKGNTVQETEAEQKLSELLSCISDGALRSRYIKKYAATHGIDKQTVEREINNLKAEKEEDPAGQSLKIPKHLKSEEEINDFKEFGFYPDSAPGRLGYYFQTQYGPEKVTNWLMRPLFMVEHSIDAKRYIELQTNIGYIVVEMPNTKINNPATFEERISNKGGFFFHGTKKQYQRLKAKFMLQFPICKEIQTLGWHYDGFFAFANGIIENGVFKKVDDHGLVSFGKQQYFLPVFSSIYINSNPEEDVYATDRKFVYKSDGVGFEKWAKKFHKVYAENNNGMFAIAFLCISIYSDFIYAIHGNFPMMNSYGMPRTGKTTCGRSIARVFRHNYVEFNLNSGSNPGITRLLSQRRNVVELADEYRNDLDGDKFQTLKQAYDRSSTPKGKATNDNKTAETVVNSCLWIAGQHQLTRDSNALLTRCVSREFVKTMDKFTNEEVKEFEELRNWEKKGLSDIIVELTRYRSMIEQQYSHEFADIGDKIRDELRSSSADGRVMHNHIIYLTVVKILMAKLKFPFTYEEFYHQVKESIIQQSSIIATSDDLAELFQMMEFLSMQGLISNDNDFKLEKNRYSITIGRDKTEMLKDYPNGVNVLYFKLTRIYPLYSEYTRRQGGQPLPQSTLISYFKTHRAYIGPIKSTRFHGHTTSAFAFDYDILDIKLNGLNDNYQHPDQNAQGAAESPKEPEHKQSVLDLNEKWPDTKTDDDLPF